MPVSDFTSQENIETFEWLISPNIIARFDERDANDYLYKMLADALAIHDEEDRAEAVSELREYISSLDYPNYPEAKDIFLNVIDKSSEYDLSAARGYQYGSLDTVASENIYFILREAWTEGNTSYLDLTTNNNVTIEAQYQQPFGRDINQLDYGSCQLLAAADTISRMPAGIEYLESLIEAKEDGTYDVTLYDQYGEPLSINVNLDESYGEGYWVDSTKDNPQLSFSPQTIQILESAFIKATHDYEINPQTGEKSFGYAFEYAMLVPGEEFTTVSSAELTPSMLERPHVAQVHFYDFNANGVYGELLYINDFLIKENHAYSIEIDFETETAILRDPSDTQAALTVSLDTLNDMKANLRIVYSDAFGESLDRLKIEKSEQIEQRIYANALKGILQEIPLMVGGIDFEIEKQNIIDQNPNIDTETLDAHIDAAKAVSDTVSAINALPPEEKDYLLGIVKSEAWKTPWAVDRSELSEYGNLLLDNLLEAQEAYYATESALINRTEYISPSPIVAATDIQIGDRVTEEILAAFGVNTLDYGLYAGTRVGDQDFIELIEEQTQKPWPLLCDELDISCNAPNLASVSQTISNEVDNSLYRDEAVAEVISASASGTSSQDYLEDAINEELEEAVSAIQTFQEEYDTVRADDEDHGRRMYYDGEIKPLDEALADYASQDIDPAIKAAAQHVIEELKDLSLTLEDVKGAINAPQITEAMQQEMHDMAKENISWGR